MKYEEPNMELIELLPRDVFMTASVGGTIIEPGGDDGADDF